jgi:flagellar biosynthesis/type III secretory pathway chaperone
MIRHEIGFDITPDIDREIPSLCGSLIAILEKEIEIYRELLAAVAEERNVLIRPSAASLQQSNVQKETLVLKTRMIEEARAGIVKKIAQRLNLDEEKINFTVLTRFLEEDQRKALQERREMLANLAGQVGRINEENRNLIDASLQHLKNSLDFLAGLMSQGSAYQRNGQVPANRLNGRLINRKG